MNFDFEKNKKVIIIGLIVLFIVFSLIRIIVMALNNDNNKEDNNNTSNNTSVNSEVSNDTKDKERLKKLKKVSEAERVRIYLGEYFKFLENKDYESAYKLLYADFKQNYFPTLEKYKEYIEKCGYPRLIAVDYDDIDAMGHYYVVTLTIKDINYSGSDSEKTIKENTKFVVKENDYDEFYLSFQL